MVQFLRQRVKIFLSKALPHDNVCSSGVKVCDVLIFTMTTVCSQIHAATAVCIH